MLGQISSFSPRKKTLILSLDLADVAGYFPDCLASNFLDFHAHYGSRRSFAGNLGATSAGKAQRDEGTSEKRSQTVTRIRKWKFENEDGFSDTAFSRWDRRH